MGIDGLRVAIAGGGVGGPAAALMLARAGAEVVLFERVADYGDAGAGYVIQANGLAVLYGLGLGELLRPHGREVRETTTVLEDGTPLARHRMPRFAYGLDHGLAISRTLMCGALRDAMLAESRVDARYGTTVLGATPAGVVRYRSAEGEVGEVSVDVVIGADGVHSAVRASGQFGARLHHTPLAVIRLLADGEPGSDERALSFYPAHGSYGERWTRYGTTIAGRNAAGRTYMSLATGSRPVRQAMRQRDLRALAQIWGEVLPPAERALSALDSFDDVLVNEIDVVTCRRWVDGRVVLLGDAAHAMPPHLGQGASSTLLDAAALACELVDAVSAGDTAYDGLTRYEARRRPAATRVQRMSWAMAIAADQLLEPGVRQLRDGVMRAVARIPGRGFSPADLRARAVVQEDPALVYESVRDIGIDGRASTGAALGQAGAADSGQAGAVDVSSSR